MVRTQLYLPEKLYKKLKIKAKSKGMTFAAYVRVYLEGDFIGDDKKEKTALERFPFLKFAGKFNLGPNASNNEEIDKAIYNF